MMMYPEKKHMVTGPPSAIRQPPAASHLCSSGGIQLQQICLPSRIMSVKQIDNLSDLPFDMLIEVAKRLKLGNLSDLPHDTLIEIAKRLKKLEDFVSFSSVSKSLRAAAKKDFFEGLRLRQRTPYLMLPVRDGSDDTREFYSLVEGESIVASVKVANFKNKKCLESLGWLLVSELDGSMSLVDPFLGSQISLPHQNTFPEYEEFEMDVHGFFEKMVLSSRPIETSDFVLMVIAGDMRHLGFWRSGDKAWNKIETREGAFSDVVYYGGGQFYALSYPGIVWVFNVSGSDNQIEGGIVSYFIPKNVVNLKQLEDGFVSGFGNVLVDCKRLYIVKTVDDSLLIITRIALGVGEGVDDDEDEDENDLSYMTTTFQVYEVDTATGTFKEIYSLGSMAVFLGHNSTIAVDVSRFCGGVIKANHIYFTDDNWEIYTFLPNGGGIDSGVYNMETETIEPIYPGEVLCSKVSPSTWITPCF